MIFWKFFTKQIDYQSLDDFWQRGSLFICLLILGENFATGGEPHAWFP